MLHVTITLNRLMKRGDTKKPMVMSLTDSHHPFLCTQRSYMTRYAAKTPPANSRNLIIDIIILQRYEN